MIRVDAHPSFISTVDVDGGVTDSAAALNEEFPPGISATIDVSRDLSLQLMKRGSKNGSGMLCA